MNKSLFFNKHSAEGLCQVFCPNIWPAAYVEFLLLQEKAEKDYILLALLSF